MTEQKTPGDRKITAPLPPWGLGAEVAWGLSLLYVSAQLSPVRKAAPGARPHASPNPRAGLWMEWGRGGEAGGAGRPSARGAQHLLTESAS